MNGWTLWQYKKIAKSFLAGCDSGMREVLTRRLYTLSEMGNECSMPVSEPLGEGLFALHGRSGKVRGRLIYYFAPDRRIIFVHAFSKTTRKIDRHDMEIARRNKQLIEKGREIANGFDFTN